MKKLVRKIHLWIFPLLECLFIALSLVIVESNMWLALLGILLSALLLNFSLHISFHHQVHFKNSNTILNSLVELIFSLLMGIPFKNYQMGHLSHHKYNNNLKDFTSTWKGKPDHPIAQGIWSYSFLWFLKAKEMKGNRAMAIAEGYYSSKIKSQQKLESLGLLLLISGLFYYSFWVGLVYIMIIYLGWAFVSLHNYGQHPPLKYGKPKGYSYYNRLYNFLFINNGWHEEHHENPALTYWELDAKKNTDLEYPHLVDGFFKSKNSNFEL